MVLASPAASELTASAIVVMAALAWIVSKLVSAVIKAVRGRGPAPREQAPTNTPDEHAPTNTPDEPVGTHPKITDLAQQERLLNNPKIADAAELERLLNNPQIADAAQLERLLASSKVTNASHLERLIGYHGGANLEHLLAQPNSLWDGQFGPAKTEAQQAADYAAANGGNAQPGYVGNRPWGNGGHPRDMILPTQDAAGNPITYKEYDIHPYTPGVNRGPERIVIGSDGRTYYTGDHYQNFTLFP